ncbi:MAG TPA: HAD family hydrolase [Verrucomicrobiae bacterium]|nr:HAD family hydrolase [Verrucomicrobiae bacterium]
MKYEALATDFDGTIAWHAAVTEATVEALRRLRESGRRLLLVTGRELPELLDIFAPIKVFDRVVGENGALLYTPATGDVRVLANPPPEQFVDELREIGVHPLSVGRVIVATQETFHGVLTDAIQAWGLPLQVIPNKGALMVLPSGVDKATGLLAALEELDLCPEQVVGIGDAENDLAFLRICGCSAAVGNALPEVREKVRLTTLGTRGEGVEELIERLLANDLAGIPAANGN